MVMRTLVRPTWSEEVVVHTLGSGMVGVSAEFVQLMIGTLESLERLRNNLLGLKGQVISMETVSQVFQAVSVFHGNNTMDSLGHTLSVLSETPSDRVREVLRELHICFGVILHRGVMEAEEAREKTEKLITKLLTLVSTAQ